MKRAQTINCIFMNTDEKYIGVHIAKIRDTRNHAKNKHDHVPFPYAVHDCLDHCYVPKT